MDFLLGASTDHMCLLIWRKAVAEHLRAKGYVELADAEDERALQAFAVVHERRTFYRLPKEDAGTTWWTLADRVQAALALEMAGRLQEELESETRERQRDREKEDKAGRLRR